MVIELRNIKKSFGENEVLCGVSFRFTPDTPSVVTGESGSGKTTLLRIVMGLETADDGEVVFSESGVVAQKRDSVRFTAVFQEDRLLEGFDAEDNIALAAGISDRAAIRKELLRLLPEDALGKPVRLLSGGQRRRVAIVRACAAQSDAVIMDEPFSGLDPENAKRAWEYILEKCADKPVIIAAHEPDVPKDCTVLSVR